MADMDVSQGRGRRTDWINLGFIGFLIAYLATATALRGQFDVRYNDTTIVHSRLRGDPERTADRLRGELTSWTYWKKLLLVGNEGDAVAGHRPDAYRPLQSAYGDLAALLYLGLGPIPAYLPCFLLLVLSSYLIFQLFRAVGSIELAACAAAAYLFFPAVVSPAWNPLAGPQSIIPGCFAAALLLYLRYLRSGRNWLLVPLAAICTIGPAYKETLGCIAFLLLTHYLVAAPIKRWGTAAGLALACVHGLFPATVIRLVLTGQLTWVSIFQCGSLRDHAVARTWRPEFLMDLLAFVPPSLLLVSLAGVLACACVMKPAVRLTLPAWLVRYAVPLARGVLLVAAGAAIVAVAALIVGRPIVGQAAAASLAFAAVSLYGLLYVDLLIAGWFCCTFLPLTRIYFNTTQCGYVAAPLIYLTAAPLFDCGRMLAAWKFSVSVRRALQGALVVIGLVAFCDNALSVPNSWIAYLKTGEFNDGLIPTDLRKRLAEPNAMQNWAFIENSVVVDDAAILATGFVFGRGRYNFDFGVPPKRVLITEGDVQRILGSCHCVLVIADHLVSHRAYFWDLRSIEQHFRKVGEQQVDFAAYYADPLRRRFDNRYRSMMAPPDFQDEFAKETRWFQERFTNHYRVLVREKASVASLGLTRMVAVEVAPQGRPAVAGSPQPELCVGGVHGFNIIRCGDKYFGLRQADGEFILEKALSHRYPVCIEGTGVEHVKRLIENSVAASVARKPDQAPPAVAGPPQPELCAEGVHGFNIIRCGDKYFGLRQGDGEFVLQKALSHQYPVCHEGAGVEQVKRLIEESVAASVARKP